MKVALVQDWLVKFGGAEWTLQNWHKIFPDAPLYTLVYDEKVMGEQFKDFDVRTTYIQKIPGAVKNYQVLLSFMPRAWESLDLTEYDLVLSSCSSLCKGIITRPDAVHVCYCHTPPRYLWDLYYDYKKSANPIKKFFMPSQIHKLRMWDRLAADRVDYFIANSKFTQKRIKKFYGRDSEVIYSVGGNFVSDQLYAQTTKEDFYLISGRLESYKKVDLAIEACNKLGKKLVVIGKGKEMDRMKGIAGPTIEFKGFVTNDEMVEYYAKAKALLFPGVEDFGFVPVEAQSGGTPVIGYGRGGILETVVEGRTGVFFKEQTLECLCDAIPRFETMTFDADVIREHALSFDAAHFREQIERFCTEKYAERQML